MHMPTTTSFYLFGVSYAFSRTLDIHVRMRKLTLRCMGTINDLPYCDVKVLNGTLVVYRSSLMASVVSDVKS